MKDVFGSFTKHAFITKVKRMCIITNRVPEVWLPLCHWQVKKSPVISMNPDSEQRIKMKWEVYTVCGVHVEAVKKDKG